MGRKILKKAMIIISCCCILVITVFTLLKVAVKNHRQKLDIATAEHSVESREEKDYINAYITNSDEKKVCFYYDDGFHEMKTSSKLTQDLSGYIADITAIGGMITNITVKTTEFTGKVLTAGNNSVEIEGYGQLECDENIKIYREKNASCEVKTAEEYLLGFSEANFVLYDNKIQAAIVSVEPTNMVKVMISNSDFSSLFHSTVDLYSEGGMRVYYENGTPFQKGEFSDGESISINTTSFLAGYDKSEEIPVYLCVEPVNSEISIQSIMRNGKIPSYRGRFYIRLYEQGFTIINELPVEEYLYDVVPSEMPAEYPEEALKVQAICARSFVYKQMEGSTYAVYGAHVDDSTNCQVYNIQEESDKVNDAVDTTNGQVIYDGNNLVKAYYYSCSCGFGASIDEAWGGEENKIYTGKMLSDNSKKVDISEEKNFRKFIDEDVVMYSLEGGLITDKLSCFEKDYPWYRYTVEGTVKELSEQINNNLKYIEATPSILQKDSNEYVEKYIESVGEIIEITVTQRGKTGIAKEICIKGSEKEILVTGQSMIRRVFGMSDLMITLNDGSERTGMNMLPSAFFYIDIDKDKFVLKGGGYGHGVGMSQDCAGAMAEKGMCYEDIIGMFFEGVSVKSIYDI